MTTYHEHKWDFAFLDLNHTGVRARYLEKVWEQLLVGGYLLIDDVHKTPYRAQVGEFLEGVGADRINVRKETLDKFGRYCWLVQKVETVNLAMPTQAATREC